MTTIVRAQPAHTLLAAAGAMMCHCPSSNAVLGSGLFPRRRHLDAGVRVALGPAHLLYLTTLEPANPPTRL